MTSKDAVHYTYIETPVGQMFALERGGRLLRLEFPREEPRQLDPDWVPSSDPFGDLSTQLTEFFDGDRREFTLEIQPEGTNFQMEVWSALQGIPYGETATYGEIAAAIGRPTAVRAVGGANNANCIPLIIPCHRVIGADGSLTGFGGGLDTKAWLLSLESGVVGDSHAPDNQVA